jgi:CDP-glycerol glycerophosphotransferase
MLAKCFLFNPMRFRYTGHPRNDVLLSGRKEELLPLNIPTVPPYSKVILYCPTYRRNKRADFFPFPDLDLEDFNRFLEEHKLLVLLRGHAYESELEKSIFSSRIIDFSFTRCNDINPILPSIDMVITDYSAIFIDYLNLNRPCLFIPYDLESYQQDPGLLFDDYPYWAPGNHVLTYAEFITALKEILNGNDIYESRRKEINRQFNYYQTGDSCQNVFELIENRQRNH